MVRVQVARPPIGSEGTPESERRPATSRKPQHIKGLSADGSTRAWRRTRDRLPGKPRRCPDGSKPFVDHIVPRYKGGRDVPSNLRWLCGKNPYTGRPKGH